MAPLRLHEKFFLTGSLFTDWLVFQVAWFLLVTIKNAWIGLAVTLACLVLTRTSIFCHKNRKHFYFKTLLLGIIFDQLMLTTGVIRLPESTEASVVLMPIWLIGMWILFATFAQTLFRWFSGKTLIAILVGGCAGPFTYWGASRMDAITIPSIAIFAVLYSIYWASWLGWVSLQDSTE